MVANGVVSTVHGVRILAIAEIRGKLSQLNELAQLHSAHCIVHTGNFGFFDRDSTKRIAPKTLRHIAMFSPLVDPSSIPEPGHEAELSGDALSELPQFLSGELSLDVPVYTVYGASEDLVVIEQFKSGAYSVPNLHLIDESTSYQIPTHTGPAIRLFGLGGSLILHRFFDNGDGQSTIAGTPGLMWTTALQIGQLIQTVRSSFAANEIRLMVSHPCPSRESLLLLLATALRADFTISSGLHFIYGSSFNEYTTQPTPEHFAAKLQAGQTQFLDIWTSVKEQVEQLVESNTKHKQLLAYVLDVYQKMPLQASEDAIISAYKNMWHYNLCDVEHGSLVLDVHNGRVATESKSQGFSFDYRQKRANAFKEAMTSTKPHISDLPTTPGKSAPGTVNNSTTTPLTPLPPGIWLAHGNVSEEQIRSYFDEEDSKKIVSITFKESHKQPERKNASVVFESEADAKTALAKLDREKTGPASLLGVRAPRPLGNRQSNPSFRGRGGFRRRGGGFNPDRRNSDKSAPAGGPSKE